MKVNLFEGVYSAQESKELLTQMIHVKIKFNEQKIAENSNEEDIKMREQRIKLLQKELYEARQFIDQQNRSISITGEISIQN